jgi:EF-hand domain
MSSIKMDELLVSWLGSDDVYENVMELIEQYRQAAAAQHYQDTVVEQLKQNKRKLLQKQRQQREEQEEDEEEDDDHDDEDVEEDEEEGGEETTKKMAANDENKKQHMNIHKFDSSSSDVDSQSSPRGVAVSSSSIPPFYPHAKSSSSFNERRRRRRTPLTQYDTWDPLPDAAGGAASTTASAAAAATSSADTRTTSPNDVVGGGIPPSISSTLSDSSLHNNNQQQQQPPPNMALSVRDQVRAIFAEFGQDAATAAAAGPDDGSTSSPNMAAASSSSSSDSDSVHSGKGGTGRGVAARSATTMTKNQKENEDENLDDNNGMENDKKIASVPSAATTASIIESPGARPASIPPDDADPLAKKSIPPHAFGRITKDICRFPSFFCHPLYQRILDLWNMEKQNQQTQQAQAERQQQQQELGEQPSLSSLGGDEDDEFQQQQQQQPPAAVQVETVVTLEMMEWFWKTEMEPHDPCDRFYRLVKQPHLDYICRDDFLPFIKALLQDHPGLEFLASHSEFQEKYAVTVITRIFYCVNKCHSGRITSRQVRRSDLCAAFHQVDEEEDINKVTRYFSYEHFYVLYCRFWELDHDRDYRITREDLLKYGDHSLSHMIVEYV